MDYLAISGSGELELRGLGKLGEPGSHSDLCPSGTSAASLNGPKRPALRRNNHNGFCEIDVSSFRCCVNQFEFSTQGGRQNEMTSFPIQRLHVSSDDRPMNKRVGLDNPDCLPPCVYALAEIRP